MSWKVTPLYFFYQSFTYTLDKKSPSKWNFPTFGWLGKNSPNSSCHIGNHKLFFLKKTSISWEITLLYFFSRNFIWFGQKEPTKMQNLRLSTVHVKFHQVSTLICSFCWKYIILAKKVQKSYISWHWRAMLNLKKKWFVVSQITRIWSVLIRALESLKNFYFDWFPLCKAYNVWPKKVQKSYFSWH